MMRITCPIIATKVTPMPKSNDNNKLCKLTEMYVCYHYRHTTRNRHHPIIGFGKFRCNTKVTQPHRREMINPFAQLVVDKYLYNSSKVEIKLNNNPSLTAGKSMMVVGLPRVAPLPLGMVLGCLNNHRIKLKRMIIFSQCLNRRLKLVRTM